MACDGLTGRCKLMWSVDGSGVRRLPTGRPNSRETPGGRQATAVAPVPELAEDAVDLADLSPNSPNPAPRAAVCTVSRVLDAQASISGQSVNCDSSLNREGAHQHCDLVSVCAALAELPPLASRSHGVAALLTKKSSASVGCRRDAPQPVMDILRPPLPLQCQNNSFNPRHSSASFYLHCFLSHTPTDSQIIQHVFPSSPPYAPHPRAH